MGVAYLLVGEHPGSVQHLASYGICVLGTALTLLVFRARAASCQLDISADQKHQQPWVKHKFQSPSQNYGTAWCALDTLSVC